MKKIGLVTCYIDNYGACLQAYALQNVILDLGYDCNIIKYSYVKNISKSKSLKYATVNFIKDPFKYIKNIQKIKKKYENYSLRSGRFMQFKDKYLKFDPIHYFSPQDLIDNPPDYDSFVCGSDQIWNPTIHNNENNLAYFLDFVPENKKRIAYAPSIGVDVIPEQCKEDMARLLNKMDYISVREIAGAKIVKNLIDKEPRVVLDPTLLYDGEKWSKIAKDINIGKPYILCYLFGEQDYIGEFIEHLRKITGYDVVVLPFTDREAQSDYIKIYDAGPSEFLGLIKNAAIICTDSFHATAFAINFNKSFYSLLRHTQNDTSSMNSRIFSILELLELQSRMITPEDSFPTEGIIDLEYKRTNDILNQKRQEDKEFLKLALEGEAIE